jgi:hypothetical protein
MKIEGEHLSWNRPGLGLNLEDGECCENEIVNDANHLLGEEVRGKTMAILRPKSEDIKEEVPGFFVG